MSLPLRFNRMEVAGSLGDLGTLLPIAMAMILINGLPALGVFFCIGLFYILAGLFYGVTVPVQPMKVIGAYAIATALTPEQIAASALLLGIILLLVGWTGIIDLIRRITPKSVIRGIQLSTGTLLLSSGIRFMLGTTQFQNVQQAAEPALALQHFGPLPIGVVLGVLGGLVTLFLINNRRWPGGLAVLVLGTGCGLLFGAGSGLGDVDPGLYLPSLFPFGLPGGADLSFALLALVLPQLPMTVGNACLAYTDLAEHYFEKRAQRVTNKNACFSMGLANLTAFILGGMPMCHGAGGLAAHYRFGARTAGSNLIIGTLFLGLALVFGPHSVALLQLLPLAILGVLLVFAGAQLALTILDLETRKELFVAVLIMGITLAANLAVGFVVGVGVAWVLKSERFGI